MTILECAKNTGGKAAHFNYGGFSLKTAYVRNRERLSNHVKRHRRKYIAGGICLVLGSIVGVILSINKKVEDASTALSVLKSARSRQVPPTPDIRVLVDNNIVNYIGRNGHPGNVIYCNETKQVFKSHREATRELGIDSRDLWAYLKGIKPDARGYTFTRVGEAQNSKTS